MFRPSSSLLERSSLDGHNPVYWPSRAYARIKLEEYARAVRDASKAIELDGTYCKGYYMRGVAYLAIRKFREALRDFQQASKICPRNFDVAKRVKECENGLMQHRGGIILPEPKPTPSTNHRGAIILPEPTPAAKLKGAIVLPEPRRHSSADSVKGSPQNLFVTRSESDDMIQLEAAIGPNTSQGR